MSIVDRPNHAPAIGNVSSSFESRLDAGSAFPLASVRADAGWIGPDFVSVASVVGSAHLHRGRTGQDTYDFYQSGAGDLAVAVADGLGSHPATSQIGALLAARQLCRRLIETASHEADLADAATGAVAQASADVCNLASTYYELDAARVPCTAAFCWLRQSKPSQVVIGRIGDADGFVVMKCPGTDDHGPLQPCFDVGMGTARKGPANVVKSWLPYPGASPNLELWSAPLSTVHYLALTTDGVSSDLSGSPGIRRWLEHRWRRPCSASWMLQSLRYRRQGSLDDRTAAVIWVNPSSRDVAVDDDSMLPHP